MQIVYTSRAPVDCNQFTNCCTTYTQFSQSTRINTFDMQIFI